MPACLVAPGAAGRVAAARWAAAARPAGRRARRGHRPARCRRSGPATARPGAPGRVPRSAAGPRPRRARAAVAAPMPDEPPVTSATAPVEPHGASLSRTGAPSQGATPHGDRTPRRRRPGRGGQAPGPGGQGHRRGGAGPVPRRPGPGHGPGGAWGSGPAAVGSLRSGASVPDQQRTMSRMDSRPVTSLPSTTTRCRNPARTMVDAACSRVQSGEAYTTSAVRCARGQLGVGILARAEGVEDVALGQDADAGVLRVDDHGRAHAAGRHQAGGLTQRMRGPDRQDQRGHPVPYLHRASLPRDLRRGWGQRHAGARCRDAIGGTALVPL